MAECYKPYPSGQYLLQYSSDNEYRYQGDWSCWKTSWRDESQRIVSVRCGIWPLFVVWNSMNWSFCIIFTMQLKIRRATWNTVWTGAEGMIPNPQQLFPEWTQEPILVIWFTVLGRTQRSSSVMSQRLWLYMQVLFKRDERSFLAAVLNPDETRLFPLIMML